ncbi:MAG: FHA domain-containing protein, partial [Bacteroidota bacterium]
MRVHLTWTGPEGDGEWTGDLPVVLGREGDVVITDAQLSRQHARLEASGEAIIITDLGSSNGTSIGGSPVDQATLPADGQFSLGRVDVTARSLAPPPEAATVRVDPQATVRVDAEPVLPVEPQVVVTVTHSETGETTTVRHASPFRIGKRDDCEVVLDDARVSRHHATVRVEASGGTFALVVTDEGSSNGTTSNGQRIETARLGASGEVHIQPFTLRLVLEGIAAEPEGGSERVQPAVDATPEAPPVTPPPPAETLATPEAAPDPFASLQHGIDPRDGASLADEEASIVFDAESLRPVAVARNFPPALFDEPVVPVDALQRDGRPILEADYVAIGGGLGNFVWVDMLRIGGVPASRIAVLGLEPKPHSRYERLCINSQIPDHERLRSDSGSCPDNIWGWPGYAVREAWKETFTGSIGTAARAVWKIFNEPTFATTYTPRSGEVFDSIDVEAARIGWDQMRHPARVRAIRKTDDGRYAIAYTVPTDDPDRESYAHAR